MGNHGGEGKMTRPSQYFTPNTGQRPYTFVDILNGINDQINGINDLSQSSTDAGTLINVFANLSTDSVGVSDTVTITTNASGNVLWDSGLIFSQGVWQ